MEKEFKVSLETWKAIMTKKIEEDYPSVDAVLKDLLNLKGGKK